MLCVIHSSSHRPPKQSTNHYFDIFNDLNFSWSKLCPFPIVSNAAFIHLRPEPHSLSSDLSWSKIGRRHG